MNFLELQPLTPPLLPATVELDQRCFKGLWTLDGYRRELESPNSELLVLKLAGEGGKENREEGKTPKQRRQGTEFPASDPLLPLSPPPQNLRSSPPPPLLALGSYWAILEEAHITILAVDPDYQRQGLGQALLWALLNSAHRRGLERSTLEVRISNQSALSLYEKFGFREAGRRKKYYQDTGEDALILWRSGLQSPAFGELLQSWWQQADDRLRSRGWKLFADWEQPNVKKTSLTCESFSVNNLPSEEFP
ncbi:MAG: ribosomal protein S18-alanine N-acetyltransferase [Kovacikia sp.]